MSPANILKLTTASLRKALKDPKSDTRLKAEVYDILLYRKRLAMRRIPGQRRVGGGRAS